VQLRTHCLSSWQLVPVLLTSLSASNMLFGSRLNKLGSSFKQSPLAALISKLFTQTGSTGGLYTNAAQFTTYTSNTPVTASGDAVGFVAGGIPQSNKFLNLPGTSGAYASTPDSAGLDIVGDIDIRCEAALVDWTPATTNCLVNKYVTATNQRSYSFQIAATTGLPFLLVSENGSAGVQFTATAAPSVADGGRIWLRATFDLDNGASNSVASFFTSSDGESWTALGTQVTGVVFSTLFASTAPLWVGADGAGNLRATGRIYSAQVYASINGTDLRADFNPSRDYSAARGTTMVSSTTGETYTINGTALVQAEGDLYQLVSAARPTNAEWPRGGDRAAGKPYAAFFNGLSGSYITSPDSAGLDITSVIDVRLDTALETWTPAARQTLLQKNLSYALQIEPSGALRAAWTTDGATVVSGTSTASVSASAGGRKFVRYTMTGDNGAGGYTLVFYTSDNGSDWQQLGDTIVGGAPTSMFIGTAILSLGADATGTSNRLVGKIYRAQIFASTNGTSLRADFDADDYVSGTSLTSSATGEIYSIQGSAFIGSGTLVNTALWNRSIPGIPSVRGWYFDLVDDAFTTQLDAGTYTVVLAGEKGIWIEDYVHAGGAWTYGPTTWTGGPTGGITNLIGNRLMSGSMIIDRTLTTTERAQVVANLMAQGAPGVWESSANLWTIPVTSIGASWTDNGNESYTNNGGTDTLRDDIAGLAANDLMFSQVTCVGRTAGTCQWQLNGGVGVVLPGLTANAVFRTTNLAVTGTIGMRFVAGAGFDGTVSGISCKRITLNTAP
jgi:hypothetical protein